MRSTTANEIRSEKRNHEKKKKTWQKRSVLWLARSRVGDEMRHNSGNGCPVTKNSCRLLINYTGEGNAYVRSCSFVSDCRFCWKHLRLSVSASASSFRVFEFPGIVKKKNSTSSLMFVNSVFVCPAVSSFVSRRFLYETNRV